MLEYWVRIEGEDEPQIVHARYAEEAVEMWANSYDACDTDYPIVSGRETPVVLLTSPSGTTRRFRVTGEVVHSYSTQEIAL